MLRRIVLISCLVALTPDVAQAKNGGFSSCEAAQTYGANTIRAWIASSFPRIQCNGSGLPGLHRLLVQLLAMYSLPFNDTDAHKLCIYRGFFQGLTEQLARQYAGCGGSADFTCLDRTTLAAEAGAILNAMSRALAVPASFDASEISFVFSGEPEDSPYVPWCGSAPLDGCSSAMTASAGNAAALYGELIPELASLVCVVPEPPAEPDAGTADDGGISEPGDAGVDAGP
jgi:hypothetical protein